MFFQTVYILDQKNLLNERSFRWHFTDYTGLTVAIYVADIITVDDSFESYLTRVIKTANLFTSWLCNAPQENQLHIIYESGVSLFSNWFKENDYISVGSGKEKDVRQMHTFYKKVRFEN